jgi:hypothetical protein
VFDRIPPLLRQFSDTSRRLSLLMPLMEIESSSSQIWFPLKLRSFIAAQYAIPLVETSLLRLKFKTFKLC